MDDKTGRKVCQLVAGIVAADGDIDPTEDEFVKRLTRWFNLFWVKREDLQPLPTAAQAAAEMKSLAPDVQQEVLELMIQAVAADRRYVDEERKYLERVAVVVGVPNDELDRRVAQAIQRL